MYTVCGISDSVDAGPNRGVVQEIYDDGGGCNHANTFACSLDDSPQSRRGEEDEEIVHH